MENLSQTKQIVNTKRVFTIVAIIVLVVLFVFDDYYPNSFFQAIASLFLSGGFFVGLYILFKQRTKNIAQTLFSIKSSLLVITFFIIVDLIIFVFYPPFDVFELIQTYTEAQKYSDFHILFFLVYGIVVFVYFIIFCLGYKYLLSRYAQQQPTTLIKTFIHFIYVSLGFFNLYLLFNYLISIFQDVLS